MEFKQYFEAEWKKQTAFEKMFGDIPKSNVIKTETKVMPYTLTLYRGFDADLDSLEQDEEYFYLSPKRSEQDLIWFTHKFIRGYDPLDYAKKRGEYLLTYPLEVKRHIEINTKENGETFNSTPEYFHKLSKPIENSRFYFGIELPEGWVFSYKNEKFIGCSKKLPVKKQSVRLI